MKCRGRPKKDNSRCRICKARLTDEEMKMLEYLYAETGQSVSDILRAGIKMQYNLEKYKR